MYLRPVLAGLLVAMTMTGCLRQAVRLDGHPTRPISVLQTNDSTLLTESTRFWLCSDTGDSFTCEPSCNASGQSECHNTIPLFGMSNLD